MPTASTSVRVDFTPTQMYDLVNDVRSYPNYIPLCSQTRLISETPERLRATITLAKGKLKLTFTTENEMDAGRSIRMRLIDGPFKRINGIWRFEPSGEKGCQPSFRLDYEFANALVGLAFSAFVKEVSETMVDAFCRQAAIKYGQRPRP